MSSLAPPPPTNRNLQTQSLRHPYAELLGAVTTALGALNAYEYATAKSLAGIDFDLPEAAPTVEDRVQLDAAAPLYFASELEHAGLFSTAELIAGLYASGTITQPLGPAAQLLHDFWRGRRERLDADERNAIYARVIEAPYFDRLMQALCTAIVAQADVRWVDGAGLREQVRVATHAQSLASFLTQRVDPMAAIAARDIVETINTALGFLRDRMLQAAFAVTDLWRLIAIVGNQSGTPAGMARQHVERGRSGQTVLLWLRRHYADTAIRFDPSKQEDVDVIVAAQRWLASTHTMSAAPSGSPGIESPIATVSMVA